MTRCCTLQRLLVGGLSRDGCAGIAVASASGLDSFESLVPETSDVSPYSSTAQIPHVGAPLELYRSIQAFFCPRCASDKDRNISRSVHKSDPGISDSYARWSALNLQEGAHFPVISDNCARRLRVAILLYLHGPMRRRSVPGMWWTCCIGSHN
jgi:hypothetical protein